MLNRLIEISLQDWNEKLLGSILGCFLFLCGGFYLKYDKAFFQDEPPIFAIYIKADSDTANCDAIRGADLITSKLKDYYINGVMTTNTISKTQESNTY